MPGQVRKATQAILLGLALHNYTRMTKGHLDDKVVDVEEVGFRYWAARDYIDRLKDKRQAAVSWRLRTGRSRKWGFKVEGPNRGLRVP